jgi:hypothetical protein
MLEHQERELTPYEIADIIYDLSVRDGILGLDQVKDVLRKIQTHQRSTHHIGVDYENWRLAISTTVTDGSYELAAKRAGIHPYPRIPGYTWSHTSMYAPFAICHTLVRTGGNP